MGIAEIVESQVPAKRIEIVVDRLPLKLVNVGDVILLQKQRPKRFEGGGVEIGASFPRQLGEQSWFRTPGIEVQRELGAGFARPVHEWTALAAVGVEIEHAATQRSDHWQSEDDVAQIA